MIINFLKFIKENIDVDIEKAKDYAIDVYQGKDYGYLKYNDIEDRLISFAKDDFPYGLQNIPNPLYLYRLIIARKESEINKDILGLHYVGDKDMLYDFDFLTSSSIIDETKYNDKWFIVTIKTTPNNLNIDNMLGNRAEYPTEYEYTLLDDKNLEIVNIEETDVF